MPVLLDYEIEDLVEKYWDNDDEYLTEKDRQFLVENNAMQRWEEAYFLDLAETYQGSCRSLTEVHSRFLEDFDLWDDLDNLYFECTGCGWWFEAGEDGDCPDGEHYCTDCSDEHGYGEEE